MIRKYFQDVGIIAFAETLLQLRHILLIPFITRRFGAIDYGVWSQILVLVSTLSPVVMLGTNHAVLRFFPGIEVKKQQEYLSSWMIFLLVTGAIATLPLIVFPGFTSNLLFATDEYARFLPLAALSLLFSQLVLLVKNWFKVVNSAVLFSGVNILRVLLQILAAVVMLVLGQGVYELVVYSLFADFILIVIALLVGYHRYGIGKPDFSILPTLINFGLPLVPMAFATWGLNYLDRFFLVQVSLEAVGVYSLAYSLSGQIIPLILGPFWVMFPSTASSLYNQGKTDQLQKLYERSAGVAYLLSLPACVGLSLVAQRLTLLLSTREFVVGEQVLLFLSLGAMLNVLASYYAVTLGLISKQWLSLIGNLVALAVNVIVNLTLIPRLGVTGAAIATFAAFLTRFGVLFFLSERNHVVRTDLSFPLKVSLSAGIMALVTWFGDRLGLFSFGGLIIQIVTMVTVAILVYTLSLYGLKVVRLSDLNLVKSLIGKPKKIIEVPE